jgi:prepilin-type N-terminal cleavage/methylation domain-containing protein
MYRKAQKGFTLIELLVVIAIISLLLSIVVPALRLAKRKAAAAVCLTNVKNLSLAWYTYQSENKGFLMSGNPDRPYAWIKHPEREDGKSCDLTAPAPPVTDEDEKRGIAKGMMYDYIDNFDTYHCPADTIRKSKYDGTTIFRTYAIPHCLNGGSGQYLKKFGEITLPSQRYVFVEEAEGRNDNSGAWSLMTPANLGPGKGEWQDPIGVNHGKRRILGFCDGHGEVHSWVDPHTWLRIEVFLSRSDVGFYGKLRVSNKTPIFDSGKADDTRS